MIKGNISNIENLSNLPEVIINGLNYIKNANDKRWCKLWST